MTHERAVEYKYGGLWNSRALNNQPEALHPKHSQVPTSNGTEDFILQSIFVVDPRRVELHKCMQIDNLWDILGFAAWTSTKASRTCSEQVYTPLPVIAVVPFPGGLPFWRRYRTRLNLFDANDIPAGIGVSCPLTARFRVAIRDNEMTVTTS